MKRVKHFFLLSLILVFTPNCVYSSQATRSLEQFYSSLQAGNFDKAYSLLSSEDQRQITLADFTGKTESQRLLNQKYWSHVKYKIVSSSEVNGKSVINVELTAPNLGEILGEEIALNLIRIIYQNSNEKELGLEERNELLLNKLMNGEFKDITFSETVQVIKQDHQQKIFLNLERDNEIFQLIQEAIAYGKDNKNDLAIEKLEKVLALEPDNKIANQYMEIMHKEK
jgi:hypothetical protein